jgi:hypothetical protein
VVLRERRVAHEEGLVFFGAAVDLAPGVHDEGVVGSDDDDLVDALGGDLVFVLEVGRDVHGLAAGGEGAGDGDEDDLLAGELLAGIVGLGETAGGRAGVGDGGPALRSSVSKMSFCGYICVQNAYSNLTSEGNFSPALIGAIVIVLVGGLVICWCS